MKNTGVFLTNEELAEMVELNESARTTPYFGLSGEQFVSGNDFSALAYKRMFARLTALAKSYGLPENPGKYGLTRNGEFITDK